MRSLKGEALISVAEKEFPVSVSFDLDRGWCTVSEDGRGHKDGSLGILIAFGGKIFLLFGITVKVEKQMIPAG